MRNRQRLESEEHDVPREEEEERKKSLKFQFFSSSKSVFTLCLAFRVVNSLLIQTYFNPDEHWQALEVAHHVVFGYGHLTWEWKKGIRSYLHPMIFALFYKFLALLGLDTPWFMFLYIFSISAKIQHL